MECERVIPCDILDDLCSRFIINVPDEERRDLIRICFQIESAHWFYLDFYSKHFPNKKPCGIKEFAQQIFKHLPFLQPYANNVEKIIEDWKDYKFCVPTFGAILLDEELSHVLLVQSYCSRSSWGFPKGKVNKDEPPYQCAIREVYEETGFDISNLINANEYIEANVNEQVVRLYLIPGINKNEKFEPKTRNEIKAVNWFPICDIPINKKEATLKLGTGANTFFLVSPFLRRLRQWIFDHNQRLPFKQHQRQRHKSCSDIDCIRYKASSLNLKESVEMLKSFNDKNGHSNSNMDGTCDGNTVIDDINMSSICHEISDSELKMSTNFNQRFGPEDFPQEKSKKIIHTLNKVNALESVAVVSNSCSNNMTAHEKTFISNMAGDSTNEVAYHDSSIKTPMKQNVGIISQDSAFQKVAKNKKRNRGKKGAKFSKLEETLCTGDIAAENTIKGLKFYRNELSCDNSKLSRNNIDSNEKSFTEKDSVIEKPFDSVSRWDNFKFDLNAILRSMDEAVLKK